MKTNRIAVRLKHVAEHFFKKINNEAQQFTYIMDHTLSNSESCKMCQKRRKDYPDKRNKFCKKTKFMIIKNNDKLWFNPKGFFYVGQKI